MKKNKVETFKGTGGQILIRQLKTFGIQRVSSVAGESYLAALDALVDEPEIDIITCRQEGGAAFMAESWGKLDNQTPGICFVTRGPGVTNAAIGVHTAMQDSTPLIVFMGQVGRGEKNREAFQEINVPQVFGGLAKWATEITDPARIPEIITRAFHCTVSGRPGPVVIGLPEDMLTEIADVTIAQPLNTQAVGLSSAQINQIKDALAQASKPVLLLGGSGWSDQGCKDIATFASAAHLPVIASFRRHDLFHHKDGNYVGELGTGPNPALIQSLQESDLWIVMGARLNEIATQGYTLPSAPNPRQKIIHIHQSADETNKVYQTAQGFTADLNNSAAALAAATSQFDGRGWEGWKRSLREKYEQWTEIDTASLPTWNGADMTAIFAHLRDVLPADSIITTDAGNFSGWAQRYLRYGRPARLLAPISGAMGYSVPAAIGAAIAHPQRLTLGICGDGGFMMNGQELASAMHHKAKPIIMICNNNMYGTIRMHQERDYPGRISATALTNPDFVALAKSYGAFGALVKNADDFPAIWKQAQNSGRAAVIEVQMDARQTTTQSKP
jgi:acetolactate synthase-1/2/3 large subunit